jgi:hypothetical protein
MKIIRKTVWQMTPDGFEKLYEDAYEHDGEVAHAKGGALSPGGAVNNVLDPLDLFGGKERGAANDAQRSLQYDLPRLNNLEADTARYNTSGPFGTSAWSIDPKTGRYTQTTNLAPSEQRQFDANNAIAEQMVNKAGEYAPGVADRFSYDAAVPGIADKQYSKVASLVDPVRASNGSAWEAKMANAGISPNSDAYKEVATQRGADTAAAQSGARQQATTAAIPLAQQQRQQRMGEIAQLLGAEQLNTPTTGGTGVDINGSTNAANQVGIDKANQSAASRNAMMNTFAQFVKAAY